MKFEFSFKSNRRRNHGNSRNATKTTNSLQSELKRSRPLAVHLCFFGTIFLISQFSLLLWNLPKLNNVTTGIDKINPAAESPKLTIGSAVVDDSNTTRNDHHHPYYQSSYQQGYDIVTLVHHDDMATWLQYGLKSWVRHFLPFTTPQAHIYAISSPKAFDVITEQKNQQQQNLTTNSLFDRVIPVPESLFPFTLNDTKVAQTPRGKPTWVYQQLLKVYAYQVLSTKTSKIFDDIPPIKQLFLLIDSDTVAVRPMPFLAATTTSDNNDGAAPMRPIYNVASDWTGAFVNDCLTATNIVAEVFQNTMPKAFPDHRGQRFTTITHHMMIDGLIMMEMLAEIERLHGKSTVQVFSGVQNGMSEWELYMAWIMKHHRERIAIKQIPFVNWGKCSDEILEYLRTEKDIFYLTKHDDYLPVHQCCVNSNWSSAECHCCPGGDKYCGIYKITCKSLGIKGCHDNVKTGLMLFTGAGSSRARTTLSLATGQINYKKH